MNVLTAEVRRASVVLRRARRRQRRQPRTQNRQRQPGDPGVGCAVGDEVEQRPQITEIRAAGVVGAATLQREVLVEFLEDRFHAVNRRRQRLRDSGDAPQRVGSQFLQRPVAVDRHREVGLGEQGAQHVHNAVHTAERKPIDVGPADGDRGRAQRDAP